MALTQTGFSFNGIEITEDGPYCLQSVEGWFGPPDGAADSVPRMSGHGSRLTFMRRGERQVIIGGVCFSKADRDSLFWDLRAAMSLEGMDTAELSGTMAGLTLTTQAQVQGYRPTVASGRWPKGVWEWEARWRCPDPLLYGGRLNVTSAIGTPGVGLTLPLTLPAAFPDNPTGGRVTVTNPGTAKAPAIYTLQGPITGPGISVNGGTSNQRVIQYQFDLADTDRLVIDTSQGAAFLNGEYRAPFIGSARTQALELPRGANTVEALGTGGVGSPSITVSFRPAYW